MWWTKRYSEYFSFLYYLHNQAEIMQRLIKTVSINVPVNVPATFYPLYLLLAITTAGHGEKRPASQQLDAPIAIRQPISLEIHPF